MTTLHLALTELKLRLRRPGLVIGTLALAVVIVLLFGSLYGAGDPHQIRLGLADEDGSAVSRQITTALNQSQGVLLETGRQDELLHRLEGGDLDIVIVFPSGFSDDLTALDATIRGYYDSSQPLTSRTATGTLYQAVVTMSRQLFGVAPPVDLRWQSVQTETFRLFDFLIPGLLGLILMWSTLFFSTRLARFQKRGIRKRLSLAGIRPLQIILAQASAHLLLASAQALLFLAFAVYGFDFVLRIPWTTATGLILLGAAAHLGLGYLINCRLSRPETAVIVTLAVALPVTFVSGSFFPVTTAPGLLQGVIDWLPLTALNEIFRGTFNGTHALGDLRTPLYRLVLWTAAGLVLAVKLLPWRESPVPFFGRNGRSHRE